MTGLGKFLPGALAIFGNDFRDVPACIVEYHIRPARLFGFRGTPRIIRCDVRHFAVLNDFQHAQQPRWIGVRGRCILSAHGQNVPSRLKAFRNIPFAKGSP
jgi:hypothetical protein